RLTSISIEAMHIAAGVQFPVLPFCIQPQTLCDALANVKQRQASHWLGFKQAAAVLRADGEHQLKILPIRQSVFKWQAPVVYLPGRVGYRNRLRTDNGAAMALLADVRQVRGQAVADVNHRMQVRKLVKAQGFADARREIEV